MAIATSTALIGGALIGAAGGIGGSLIGASAERAAAKDAQSFLAQQYAQQLEEQRRARKRLEPFRETGINALGQLYRSATGDFEGFETSPGYEFRLGQGVQALDRSASARGKVFSGQAGKQLTRFGQGIASDEFGNYQNRLYDLSALGLSAGQSQAGIQPGINTGGANALLAAGQATSSGATGAASAANKGIENALAAYIFRDQLRNPTINRTGGYVDPAYGYSYYGGQR